MTEPVAVPMCEEPQTRAQFVEAIEGRWFRIYRDVLAIGDLLLLASQKLDSKQFQAMVASELPFGMDWAYRLMRVRLDPKINAVDTYQLPRSLNTLDILSRLPEQAFFSGIRNGRISADTTRNEAAEYLRFIEEGKHPEEDGGSDFLPDDPSTLAILARLPEDAYIEAIRTKKISPATTPDDARRFVRDAKAAQQHRPIATQSVTAPSTPVTSVSTRGWPDTVLVARNWPEFISEIARLRKLRGYSQAEIDQLVGWDEGLMSKIEIPHRDDGRFVSMKTYGELLQVLNAGIHVVAL